MTDIIAIDIGGTYLRAALCNEKTKPDKVNPIVHRVQNSKEKIISQIHEIIVLLQQTSSRGVSKVSICSPGLVDAKKGVIRIALNLPNWVDIPLQEIISSKHSLPTTVLNDTNAGAFAQWYYKYDSNPDIVLIYVSISTGVGCGIIANGRLVTGMNGFAGELGHTTINFDGEVCFECQIGKGCVTSLASGTSIAKNAVKFPAFGKEIRVNAVELLPDTVVDAKDIFFAAKQNNRAAISILNNAGRAIGFAIINLLHLLDPHVVIVGGGVLDAGSFVSEPMYQTIQDYAMRKYYEGQIVKSNMPASTIGILGAYVYARESAVSSTS